MEWSAAQQEVLSHTGSALVVGPPGSGKTFLLLEEAARATQKGQTVALSAFAFRGLEYTKSLAQGFFPQLTAQIATGRLVCATVKDLAQRQVEQAGEKGTFATNNQVREVLRQVVAEYGFAGSLAEAEHIVRNAKSRAKKLPENDRFYGLVMAYRQKMEALGVLDRHDVIRKHVLGMKDGTVAPLPVKTLLLDNVQDITELQLIWLQMHVSAGVRVVLTADDDCTVFARDGALGAEAVSQLADWPEVTRFNLPGSYRVPQVLMPAVTKVARQLRQRHQKGDESYNAAQATLRAETFPSPAAEHAFLAATCSELLAQGQKGGRMALNSVGIITRDTFAASLVCHALRRHGLNPASFARLIWEDPTPRLVLSVLYVMLNQANNGHLLMVMIGFGLPAAYAQGLLQQGLGAADWLPRGCPLPPVEGTSPTVLAAAQRMRQAFRDAWQMMQTGAVPPREVFKALVEDMLAGLPESEHPQALLATDMLLSLSGKLTEVLPRVMKETLPDMNSPITVAPVREVRNMQFGTVILPHAGAGSWPRPGYGLLGADAEHERRMFYLAISRTAGGVLFTSHAAQPTVFLAELQQSLRQQGKKPAA